MVLEMNECSEALSEEVGLRQHTFLMTGTDATSHSVEENPANVYHVRMFSKCIWEGSPWEFVDKMRNGP